MTVPRPHTNERVVALPCRAGCRVDPALRQHHDRLLTVESDVNELLELVELAVTWDELDYSSAGLVPPGQWLEFAACHEWRDQALAVRIFSLVTDIALRADRCRAAYPPLGEVVTGSRQGYHVRSGRAG
ncbi:MAG: hypothetical protein ACRDTX_29820 [Pseudonocardiaceae bacterium]